MFYLTSFLKSLCSLYIFSLYSLLDTQYPAILKWLQNLVKVFKKLSYSNVFPFVCLLLLCQVPLLFISSYHLLHFPHFLKIIDCMSFCNLCTANGDFVAEVKHTPSHSTIRNTQNLSAKSPTQRCYLIRNNNSHPSHTREHLLWSQKAD